MYRLTTPLLLLAAVLFGASPDATADTTATDEIRLDRTSDDLRPHVEARDQRDRVAELAEVLDARMLLPNGRHHIVHCRRAPDGCETRVHHFARYLTDAGDDHAIDPYLLAALAVRESALDPSAVSRVGAAGILQLHPRGVGRHVPFVRDHRVRTRCLRQPGACQRPVVDVGAAHLSRWLTACEGVEAAIGGYAAGRCGGAPTHARGVLLELERLRGLRG